MSEHANDPADAAEQAPGDQAVDRVLASLSGLDEAPVAEHVPVFEAAHEQLRRALDAPPGS
ncbi:hypothetical protein [Nocardioides sp. LHG3406-4]|uniref:hypothetical protein n=1 Tax=Nocardioides sp. LHG3406-4 TaxID=2804575 RepID=UPI003CE91263